MEDLISIIIPTYNRAHIIRQAISSVLSQDYLNWELIVVDDGSSDNTKEIINGFKDQRIKYFKHDTNRGAVAAKNTGLDHLTGNWFTILDSDDEMVPDALSTMLELLVKVNPQINAITCNCIDTRTGKFSGKFLNNNLGHDQYLDNETIFRYCRGEFWGITKTNLLNGNRFNEKTDSENGLWHKINQISLRYYLHRGLRIYHTEGNDRESNFCQKFDSLVIYNRLVALEEETEYLSQIMKFCPDEYRIFKFHTGLCSIYQKDIKRANECFRELYVYPGGKSRAFFLLIGIIFGSHIINIGYVLKNKLF
jgi:GalNAc5-diNAcBac-PP-undecaprenol beta-1,3-glucosyltransferase